MPLANRMRMAASALTPPSGPPECDSDNWTQAIFANFNSSLSGSYPAIVDEVVGDFTDGQFYADTTYGGSYISLDSAVLIANVRLVENTSGVSYEVFVEDAADGNTPISIGTSTLNNENKSFPVSPPILSTKIVVQNLGTPGGVSFSAGEIDYCEP